MLSNRPRFILDRLGHFLTLSLEDVLKAHMNLDPQECVLRHFHEVADTVPAYGHFLRERGIDAAAITTFAGFQTLPLVTKPNYIQAHPLPDRCRGGSLTDCDRLAVSSGSTGIPTFWPRSVAHELDVALRFEQVFRHSFGAHERQTLAVVCFPLGNWVGGIFTASCCWLLAMKGYPLTVATPGKNPAEILRIVRELAPHFSQTVLLGYPPFVKDVVDTGLAEGLDWKRLGIKMVFAGEVFSEEWRQTMADRVGATRLCHDFASLYGTADGGVLGNETPISIAIRRFLADNPKATRELFGESRLPTLVQYDPISRFLELVDDTLVVTGDGGVPLVRYHIADRGGLRSFSDMLGFVSDWGVKLSDYGLDGDDARLELPFVWVFGRADFTVSFYGANVYPENVVVGLEQADIGPWVTGKFVMETRTDAEDSEYLHITVELAPNVSETPDMKTRLADSIVIQLVRLNSEFANYVPKAKQTPHIETRAFADPEYFPRGVKHRYTRH